jgi:hypothetical protein
MSKREFKDAALTRLDHPLFAPARLAHVHATFLPAQDDISHPDSERELVLRGSLGVEPRELGDELVRLSLDRYLRISPFGGWLTDCLYQERSHAGIRQPVTSA